MAHGGPEEALGRDRQLEPLSQEQPGLVKSVCVLWIPRAWVLDRSLEDYPRLGVGQASSSVVWQRAHDMLLCFLVVV